MMTGKRRTLFYILIVTFGLTFLLKVSKNLNNESVVTAADLEDAGKEVPEALKVKLSGEERRRIKESRLNIEELFSSVSKGEVDLLSAYLLEGGDPDQTLGKLKMSLLGRASYDGNLEALTLLVGAGADTEYVDDAGNTPLMLSLMQDKNKNVYEVLIKPDMDIDHKNLNKQDALLLTVQSFNYEALRQVLLLKTSGRKSVERAFLLSVEHQDQTQMQIFIELESWVLRTRFDNKLGPVYWACENSKIKSLEFLLSEIEGPSDKFRRDLVSFSKVKSLRCKEFFEVVS